ncbi:hypothetical protein E2562_028834 [Oryza meyeriana var. granulata]|uniref:Leucine-rich repeat-containing N-terminal plant-type domain-containing protein n=1 Tax=Oryza meyeriana var. granulata TaxID=110450 RepID=A0A6G1FD94_9ORYZ|nr:hypothetical protein E2562_028834 [Oryza meyeriana var. granulata]
MLKAGHNNISGALPDDLFRATSLEHLSFPNNGLQGTIDGELLIKLSDLVFLDLGGNRFSGKLSVSIGQLKRLEELRLDHNYISGELPSTLANCINLAAIVLKSNKFTGDLAKYHTTNAFPKMLNLGNNKFSGAIPKEIGQLKALLSLNLSFNNLHGEIPQSASNLKNLMVLDLSSNHLTGAIPLSLVNLHFLSEFNISYNDLEGPVPIIGQFSTFPSSSFAGNPKLCSPMLLHHCDSAEAAPVSAISTKQYVDKVVFAIAIGVFFGVGVLYDQIIVSRFFG